MRAIVEIDLIRAEIGSNSKRAAYGQAWSIKSADQVAVFDPPILAQPGRTPPHSGSAFEIEVGDHDDRLSELYRPNAVAGFCKTLRRTCSAGCAKSAEPVRFRSFGRLHQEPVDHPASTSRVHRIDFRSTSPHSVEMKKTINAKEPNETRKRNRHN